MAIILTQLTQAQAPIDFDGISPETLAGRTRGEIERLPVRLGNRRVPLGELFAVAGDPSDESLVLQGDFASVHRIGAKLSRGRIHVCGSAGRHAGSDMTGGEIVVDGDAADWLGGEMRGGLIRVRGDAASHVGAAYAGSPRGMTSGTILIHGNAGSDAGASMRRGLIAIGGAVGDFVGAGMLAGTILVFGDPGRHPGIGMRRGTIGLFGQRRPALLPSFRRGAEFHPPMLRLLLRHVQMLEFSVDPAHEQRLVQLYHGDALARGRGEILLPAG